MLSASPSASPSSPVRWARRCSATSATASGASRPWSPAAADGVSTTPDRRPPRLRQHRLLGAVAALRCASAGPRPRRRGGAALLATENAPAGKRAWFGMFPQLGPSIGFLAANGLFLALAMLLSEEQFRDWGWRIPFLLSAALVVVGLTYAEAGGNPGVRQAHAAKHERVRLPIAELFAQHWRPTLLGALAMVVCYALFYISTVFSLSYGWPASASAARSSLVCCASRCSSWPPPRRCRPGSATASDASRYCCSAAWRRSPPASPWSRCSARARRSASPCSSASSCS